MLKLAIIEPPPVMVVDISNFCIGAYAHKLLSMLRGQKDNFESHILGTTSTQVKKEVEVLAKYLLKYVQKTGAKHISLGSSVSTYIAPLNFDGWNCPFGDSKKIETYLKANGFGSINCQIHFSSGGDFSGLWDARTRTLQVHIEVPELKTLNDFWLEAKKFPQHEAQLFETVEHELIHLVQLIGFYVRNTKDLIGLPPRAVKDNKQPNILPAGQKRIEESIPHALMDAEFYTNLMDAINKFARLVRYVEPKLKLKYLRIFIGASEVSPKNFPPNIQPMIGVNGFFEALMKGNPKKWKLATKRFISYIQKHPNILA